MATKTPPKFEVPAGQTETSVEPRDYKIRICVAGTRSWADKIAFHKAMCAYVKRFKEPILFISQAQYSGASRFIITWCLKYKYPCLEVKEDWDKYGKSAGFMRNTAIADTLTNLIAFYNNESPNTGDLIDKTLQRELPCKIVLIAPPKETK